MTMTRCDTVLRPLSRCFDFGKTKASLRIVRPVYLLWPNWILPPPQPSKCLSAILDMLYCKLALQVDCLCWGTTCFTCCTAVYSSVYRWGHVGPTLSSNLANCERFPMENTIFTYNIYIIFALCLASAQAFPSRYLKTMAAIWGVCLLSQGGVVQPDESAQRVLRFCLMPRKFATRAAASTNRWDVEQKSSRVTVPTCSNMLQHVPTIHSKNSFRTAD